MISMNIFGIETEDERISTRIGFQWEKQEAAAHLRREWGWKVELPAEAGNQNWKASTPLFPTGNVKQALHIVSSSRENSFCHTWDKTPFIAFPFLMENSL